MYAIYAGRVVNTRPQEHPRRPEEEDQRIARGEHLVWEWTEVVAAPTTVPPPMSWSTIYSRDHVCVSVREACSAVVGGRWSVTAVGGRRSWIEG